MPSLYHDTVSDRIIQIGKNSTPGFWDNKWELSNRVLCDNKANVKKDPVLAITKRFLNEGSKILEGGCGNGVQLLKLVRSGYDVVGLDYAPKTVETLKIRYPDLKFILGDVENLPFANGSFDGYWSIGVIEHFINGYHQVASEMYRVLRNDGYLFLSFPFISHLRRIKMAMKKYPSWHESSKPLAGEFYQYLLDASLVAKDFERIGFKLVYIQKKNGLEGLAKEFNNRLLNDVYAGKSVSCMILKRVLENMCLPFTAHSIVLVLKK